MNFLKNPRTAVICLVVLVIAVSFTFYAQSVRPSDTLIKGLITKQMERRLKGGSIVSMKIVRGNVFHCEAHFSKTPYGTQLYPVVVRVTYTTKQPDGTMSENKEMNRTLNFYRDTTHHWVVDDQLH